MVLYYYSCAISVCVYVLYFNTHVAVLNGMAYCSLFPAHLFVHASEKVSLVVNVNTTPHNGYSLMKLVPEEYR